MKKIRKHIYFSGRVQGVGFRYRAYCAAQNLGLTGWVSNLWDGRVELEVQGKESEIQKMIAMLREGRFIEIEKIETEEISLETENGFYMK